MALVPGCMESCRVPVKGCGVEGWVASIFLERPPYLWLTTRERSSRRGNEQTRSKVCKSRKLEVM